MTEKRQFPIEMIIFLLIQLVMYVLMFTVGGNIVRYLIIVFSFLFALILISNEKNSYLTVAALGFTLMADLFLVVLEPRNQLAGMLFFCGTQICYAVRVHFNFDSKSTQKIFS